MIENNSHSLRFETNIVKLLKQSINLFRDADLNDLAEKWERILRNYFSAKMVKGY